MGNLLKGSFLFFLHLGICSSFVALDSSVVFPEGTDTSSTAIGEATHPIVTTSNSKEGNGQNVGITVAGYMGYYQYPESHIGGTV